MNFTKILIISLCIFHNIFSSDKYQQYKIIYDPYPVKLVLSNDKNIEKINFTCLFQAYIYAEAHLGTYLDFKKNEDITQVPSFDFKTFEKKVHEKINIHIKNRTFLGLSCNNYVDAKIFISLCSNAFQNGVNITCLMLQNKDYSLYNNIVFMQFRPLNGTIVGAGAAPDRKSIVNSHKDEILWSPGDKKEQAYYDGEYKKSLIIYKKIQAFYPNQEFSLDNSNRFSLLSLLINSQGEKLLEQIQHLHNNESYAFSIVASYDAQGPLHAITFTIIKNKKNIEYIFSENANEQISCDKELNVIQSFINHPKQLESLIQEYNEILNSVPDANNVGVKKIVNARNMLIILIMINFSYMIYLKKNNFPLLPKITNS